MGDTKIEWATKTWNPIVGCEPISEGCAHCYAKRIAKRFEYPGWDGMASFQNERMGHPSGWSKPQMIFVNSMGDLFHDSVPFDWLENVWNVMRDCPEHTFLILTKRPARMLEWSKMQPGYLRNVWLGVTAENQERARERIPLLMKAPAFVRFVSAEPMLGYMDLRAWLCDPIGQSIDWVIAGAETGRGKRKMSQDWFDDLRDQCQHFNVPFFGKKDSNGYPLLPREFPGGRNG